jgi:anaerobic magnesium-protoporphyrin IX monomethyl ester cyclase
MVPENGVIDVLFVDLPFITYEFGPRFKAAWNFKPVLKPYELHLGFRYMVAALRSQGFLSDILYQSGERTAAAEDQLIRHAAEKQPLILGFGSYEGSLRETLGFIERARAAGNRSIICLGGHLATFSCDEILSQFHQLIDVVVLGEGEHTIVELAAAARRNEPLHDIKGIAYYDGARVVRTPPRPVERDINRFPFPAIAETVGPIDPDMPLFVITSRGCYGRCSFCRTSQLGDGWRARDARNVVDEFEYAYHRGVTTFEIVDDNFVGPGENGKSRARAIAAELRRRRLPIRFHASCRVNDVDETTMRLLRESGLISVSLGIESGVQRILDSFNKHTTVAQNCAAVQLLSGLGIGISVYIIFFDPYMTFDEVRENLAFLRYLQTFDRVRFERVIFRKLIPVSGTELFDRLRRDGLLRGNPFDGHYFQFKDPRVGWLSDFMENLDIRAESAFFDSTFNRVDGLYWWFKTRFAFSLAEKAIPVLESAQYTSDGARERLEHVLHEELERTLQPAC